jgi:hypothetical protein
MSIERPVGARVLRAARTQLREAASEALFGALGALEARVRAGKAGGSSGHGGRQLERMREVLERDRALASATLPEPAPAPSTGPEPAATVPEAAAAAPVPAAPSTAPVVPECDEPIRTRSMARLLASQGYPERALAIYAYLLAKDGSDPALALEAAALRAAPPRAADPIRGS